MKSIVFLFIIHLYFKSIWFILYHVLSSFLAISDLSGCGCGPHLHLHGPREREQHAGVEEVHRAPPVPGEPADPGPTGRARHGGIIIIKLSLSGSYL